MQQLAGKACRMYGLRMIRQVLYRWIRSTEPRSLRRTSEALERERLIMHQQNMGIVEELRWPFAVQIFTPLYPVTYPKLPASTPNHDRGLLAFGFHQ